MKRSRFSEEQIIGILKEHEVGIAVSELCREHDYPPAEPDRPLCKMPDGVGIIDDERPIFFIDGELSIRCLTNDPAQEQHP